MRPDETQRQGEPEGASADPVRDEPLGEAAEPLGEGVQVTTILIYSAITLLGVMAGVTAKGLVDNSRDLGVLVLSAAIAVSLAHAWAGVLAHMMVHRQHLERALVIKEVRFAGLAMVPAVLVVLDLILLSLILESFDLEVTVAMMTLVGVLFLAAYVSALRAGRSHWKGLEWGGASALVGLAMVVFKVALGG